MKKLRITVFVFMLLFSFMNLSFAQLPANRIAALDRQGVQWRKFKEINVVDLNYKRNHYDSWTPVPSGLCSEVKIIPAVVE